MKPKSFILEKVILEEDKVYEICREFFHKNKGLLITYFNQNSFNTFFSNEEFRYALNDFIVYQEGIGMFIAYKLWGISDVERIDSSEVINWMLNLIISKKEPVAFIGGKFEEFDIKMRCEQKELELEFYYQGFLEEYQKNELIEKLKSIKSRFILIGMGSPQQEILAYKLFQHFPDKVFICIGNFMNYFLGYQKRAPIILRKLQLEWLYRLFQEPKRLFKRYVIGIPLFFYRVFFHFKYERNIFEHL